MTPWLAVVGIGEEGLAGLGPRARALVDSAETLVGGARHLAAVPDDGRPRFAWPRPLEAGIDRVLALRPRRVCVLATGDPMHYGIGALLARRVPDPEMTVVPAPGAFALACAELGWPRAEVETLTLHGRPVETIGAYLRSGARLLALSRDGATPAALARFLTGRGFGDSVLTVLERLGGPRFRRHPRRRARDWPPAPVADINTVAVECADGPDLPRVPGLPDSAWEHDGQLTKREVRAATLAALAPAPGAPLWDVGAGAGSVAIEWLRCHPLCRAVAVERDPARAARIRRNAAALGVPRLRVVEGAAPAALAGLEPPAAIFIGGGVADPAIWRACQAALPPGGRLVANAVTVAGEARLLEQHARHGGALVRIAVSRAETMGGGGLAWRPLRPVTQLAHVEPGAAP